MRLATYMTFLAGLAAVTALVAWRGFGAVASTLATLGAGVLLLPLIYAPHIAFAASSWSLLFRPGRRPPYLAMLRAMWIGMSVESLLPAGGVAVEVVKARLIMSAGTQGCEAVSSVVVDKTVQALVLALWGLAGVGALASTQTDSRLALTALAGAALLAAGAGAFLLAQRAGLFGFLARAGGTALRAAARQGVVESAAELDTAIREIYGRPRRIVLACAIRGLSRTLLVVELWLAASLMGHPIAPWDALMMAGLIGALRGATFVVPNAWGVQEGGYVVLGGLVGLSPEFMLALSLATRARELLISVPGLAAWQFLEGRWLGKRLGRRAPGKAGAEILRG